MASCSRSAAAGRSVVTAVSARDRTRDRGVSIDGLRMVRRSGRDGRARRCRRIVEVIGGSDGPAKATIEAAIAARRHVVTANKALLAIHGTALAKAAEAKGVTLAYEAAVAGGIPVIKALREGVAANRITRVYGILNGTCNYILTVMRETGRAFADVLKEAQASATPRPIPPSTSTGSTRRTSSPSSPASPSAPR